MSVASNIMVPIIGIDFDASLANTAAGSVPIEALIIGQKIAAGTGTAEVKYSVTNADTVATLAGLGSMAHKEAQKFFAASPNCPAQLVMLDDASGSAASTRVATISGTATAAGEFDIYVRGDRLAVSVAVGDTATEVGDAVVAKMAEYQDLSYTAANVTGAVTFTAKNKGVVAGDMDIRMNYNAGETTPAGLSVAIAALTPGTGDPDIQDVLDVIGDDWFNVTVNPYTDNTNGALINAYVTAQDDELVMRDQMWFGCLRDSRANLLTYGQDTTNHNSKGVCTVAWYQRLETPWQGAAAIAGTVAESILDDVGRPLHRMPVTGIKALDRNDNWTLTEKNQLSSNGITTLDDSVGVQTFSVVTMYLKNASGVNDTSYQQVIDVYKLMASRYRFRAQIASRYPHARLADSADNVRSGIQIITPDIGKNEALEWYRGLITDGIAENYDAFKSAVVCQRSTTNLNRLEWLLPETLVRQFIVGSATIGFK